MFCHHPLQIMVQTKKQLENLSKEELIEKLFVIDNIPTKLSELSNGLDNFSERF